MIFVRYSITLREIQLLLCDFKLILITFVSSDTLVIFNLLVGKKFCKSIDVLITSYIRINTEEPILF